MYIVLLVEGVKKRDLQALIKPWLYELPYYVHHAATLGYLCLDYIPEIGHIRKR